MPYYRTRRNRRPFYSRRPRRAKKSAKNTKVKTSSNFNKKVLKVIHRASETKITAPVLTFDNRILPYLSDFATQCVPLTPIIAQGNAQGERIGNQVSTRRCVLNVNMNAISISTSSGYVPPIYFDVYVYKYKRSDNISAVELQKFLQYGNTSVPYDSTSIPFSGNLKVNNDTFTLKCHKRVLCWSQTVSQQAIPSGGALTNCSNVTNARNLNIDITKYLNKNMKFQDATTNTPNDNLYVSVVATPNDYDAGYVATQVFGTFSTCVQYQYDDF